MYNCVLKCSSFEGATYIVYFKTICQCIVYLSVSLNTATHNCLGKCENLYDFYCLGETGLMFFAIDKRNTDPTEESLILSVDNVPPLHCLLITKGVQSIRTLKDCNQKLKKMDFEVAEESIIFRIENIYTQWKCNKSRDNKGEIIFRVIFQNHSDAIITFTDSINTTKTTNMHVDVSLTGKITTFTQNNSITEATAITTYDKTTQTVNYGMIICNCVLCILVLLVWVVLFLKHHRSRKQVSMQTTEEASSNRESSTMSNYDTISLNVIPHPIHITNETYSAALV